MSERCRHKAREKAAVDHLCPVCAQQVIAQLDEALEAATERLAEERQVLHQSCCRPSTGEVDDADAQAALDEIDRLIAKCRAALGQEVEAS